MLLILIKLPLIKTLFGDELYAVPRLIPLLSFFFPFPKIKLPLIVPYDLLISLRDRKDETVLELLDDNTLEGLALD
jgi:hypothetical protein